MSILSEDSIKQVARNLCDKLNSLTDEERQYVWDEFNLNNRAGYIRMTEGRTPLQRQFRRQLKEVRRKGKHLTSSINKKFFGDMNLETAS